MIKIYYENAFQKEELKNYITNEIGQAKIGKEVVILETSKGKDMVIDCTHLHTKDQVVRAMPMIFRELWRVYYKKLPKLQRNQKKVRRKTK